MFDDGNVPPYGPQKHADGITTVREFNKGDDPNRCLKPALLAVSIVVVVLLFPRFLRVTETAATALNAEPYTI